MTTNSKVNPSLQKKTAARMAAVQCLYTLAVTGEFLTPQQQVAQLKKRLTNNRDEQKLVVGMPLEPNYALTETLLAGVAERRGEIDALLDKSLSADWKRERISPVLIAILQCSIFELLFGKDIKPAIVLDEYARITRGFFSEAEVDFVYGALSRLAQAHG